MGAQQVAAVHRVYGDLPEPLSQGGELPVAPGRDGAVVLAVGQAVEIALGLGVADEVNPCHGHGGASLFIPTKLKTRIHYSEICRSAQERRCEISPGRCAVTFPLSAHTKGKSDRKE